MENEKTIQSMKAMLNEHTETIRNLKETLKARESELSDCVKELCFMCKWPTCCDKCRWFPLKQR